MRKIYTLFAALLLAVTSLAQPPQSFSYQAVVRDASGQVKADTEVALQADLRQSSPSGTVIYSESFSVTTNAFGLINIQIGNGTVISGTFANIEWGSDDYFLETTIDGSVLGTTQLLSVPYALYAKESGNTFSGSFSDLLNVPSGLDDGDDNTQLSETEVVLIVENNGFLTTESDPEYTSSPASSITTENIDSWNAKQDGLAAGEGIVITNNIISVSPGSSSVYLTAGSNVSITGSGTQADPYNISSTAGGGGSLPVLSSAEILSLTPYTGQSVFNITDQKFLIYDGSKWVETPLHCWPRPDDPNTGSNIILFDGSTIVQLAANIPQYGTGTWIIQEGTGGSFSDIHDPNATFSGTVGGEYKLQWSIATTCGEKYGNTITVAFGQSGPDANVNDIDGNSYSTVWIGSQLWMAENLKTTKYNDGSNIPHIGESDWSHVLPQGYCWYDFDESTYKATYGGLYSFPSIQTGKLCPDGWHIPNLQEWRFLATMLGGYEVAGGKLKETGTGNWQDPNTDATDEFGFSALPGGDRGGDGEFSSIGTIAFIWAHPEETNYSGYITIHKSFGEIGIGEYHTSSTENRMFSVRCIKD